MKLNVCSSLAYLGLGGNLGQPLSLFDEVVDYFKTHRLCLGVKESPRYTSAPVDALGPNYVNSVLQMQWQGSADNLLQTCLDLEARLGRVRTLRNAPRPIDIDVLLVDMQMIASDRLTVPHPRMHQRRFVLEPLLVLNPDVELPGLGLAREFLACTLNQDVRRI